MWDISHIWTCCKVNSDQPSAAGVVAQEPFEKLCVNITDEKAPTLLPCEGVPPPSVWVRTTLVLARPFVI